MNCPRCKNPKPQKRGYSYCKPCSAEIAREWRLKNIEHVRAYERKRYKINPRIKKSADLKLRFGITLEEKESLLESQSGGCGICRKLISGKEAHVDHCHSSGKIRGILCNSCNNGLGRFKDSPEILSCAINYLTYSGKT